MSDGTAGHPKRRRGVSAFDSALDALVAPSFSNVGIRLRRRLSQGDPPWEPVPDGAFAGKTVVVTGANSGIGLATAQAVARRRADLVMVARSPERGAAARRLVADETGASVALEIADMGAHADVRDLGTRLAAQHGHIDVLVHNAGALLSRRQNTSEGIESTFATHVLGPFALTAALLPRLRGGGRVITVASGGMYSQRLDVANLPDPASYRGSVAYAQAKRAQVILNELWAARVDPNDVAFHCMHPGWVDTPGVEDSLPRFRRIVGGRLRTTEEGADTIVWLAATTDLDPASGGFWLDRRARPTHKLPWTRESETDRDLLWDLCVSLTASTLP